MKARMEVPMLLYFDVPVSGENPEEALAKARDALAGWLRACADWDFDSLPPPPECGMTGMSLAPRYPSRGQGCDGMVVLEWVESPGEGGWDETEKETRSE